MRRRLFSAPIYAAIAYKVKGITRYEKFVYSIQLISG